MRLFRTDVWASPDAEGICGSHALEVAHMHRLSAAGAALVASALVAVAFATRMSGADTPTSAQPASVQQPAGEAPAWKDGLKQLRADGYRLVLHVTPNRAPSAIRVSVAIMRGGRPVRADRVRLTVTMLDMPMAGLTRTLGQTGPGRWDSGASNLAFGMAGRWGLRLDVTPRNARPFSVGVTDRVRD
jgi:hypothetical protein